ncbi:MAG: isoaspartyl peptidase/L-asparaginase, partial [Lacisediminimonas sp.]|nr:isoaspartyl peptidase/L-asparaginase [Lacisediminimonas sp.]
AAQMQQVVGAQGAVGGRGGLIAVDALGNLSLPFNTAGMFRGFARVGDAPQTEIFR